MPVVERRVRHPQKTQDLRKQPKHLELKRQHSPNTDRSVPEHTAEFLHYGGLGSTNPGDMPGPVTDGFPPRACIWARSFRIRRMAALLCSVQ